MDSRELIQMLKRDGWTLHSVSGSHHHFKHAAKPGKVTVPHPLKDIHPKMLKSILRQAGLL